MPKETLAFVLGLLKKLSEVIWDLQQNWKDRTELLNTLSVAFPNANILQHHDALANTKKLHWQNTTH